MEHVFHEGEEAVQKMAGEDHIAARISRALGTSIMRGAVNFIENQPMAIVGSRDENGHLWASILIGDFGFIKVENATTVTFNLSKVHSSKQDVFYRNTANHPEIGALFIELASRRRFRVNGHLQSLSDQLLLEVKEAYPNCPKYIQRGIVSLPDHFTATQAVITQGTQLGAAEKAWIQQADTFFIATQNKDRKTDASHRGGKSGFIELLEDGRLKIPDYPGNSMFNTLGNIYQNPNTGLLFVDFEKGTTLQVAGKGELLFDQQSDEDFQKTGDTGRFWIFTPEKWIRTVNHHQVNWEFMDFSPFNP